MLTLKEIQELQAKHTSRYSFTPITETVPTVGGANRDPAGATAHRSGRTALNAAGSDLWNSLCLAAGFKKEEVGASFEADVQEQVVAVRPAREGDGLMPVRWQSDASVTIYLGGCYQQLPILRPSGKKDVTVAVGSDSQGRPALLVFLKIALPKRTIARKESEKPQAKKTRATAKSKESQPAAAATPAPTATAAPVGAAELEKQQKTPSTSNSSDL